MCLEPKCPSRLAIECFNKPDKTIIHIQGMVSVIAEHCENGFLWVKHLFVPSSLLRSTIHGQAKRFERAGKDEIISIQKSGYVMVELNGMKLVLSR